MHVNKNSKGSSVDRCGREGTFQFTRIKADGRTRRALLSKWYHPRAKMFPKAGDYSVWTFMPFGTALAQGLVV